jgi:hypothetical protein
VLVEHRELTRPDRKAERIKHRYASRKVPSYSAYSVCENARSASEVLGVLCVCWLPVIESGQQIQSKRHREQQDSSACWALCTSCALQFHKLERGARSVGGPCMASERQSAVRPTA